MEIKYRDILELSPQIQEQVRLWRNSPRVRLSMVNQKEISKEEHAAWLDSLRKKAENRKLKMAFADNMPFGVIYLHEIDSINSTSDWGMYIGEEKFLGLGLGKMLLYEIMRWAFDDLKIHRLYTSVIDKNPILHTYIKAGFKHEGTWKEHIKQGNERLDLHWIACFRDFWLANKK